MSGEPSVSVIIPTWNRANTIVAAVESALIQTHAALEVLVCDNGSTDESERLIRAMTDPRVRWIPGPADGQPGFPRNRGIRAARGEWLAFLDSDDEWLPDKMGRQLAAMRASGHRASASNAWRLVPGVGRQGTMQDMGDQAFDLAQMLAANLVICSSAVFHKSLMPQLEGFAEVRRLRGIEDYTMWLRVACLTRFDYLAEPLMVYRDDLPNSLRALDRDGWAMRMAVLENFVDWCGRHPSPQTRNARQAGRIHIRLEKRNDPKRLARRAKVRRIGARVLEAVGLRRRG